MTVTWRYCDQDIGVQDTDMWDWAWDVREMRLKQVAGTRADACRDTGDQDHSVGDTGDNGRDMEDWDWNRDMRDMGAS